MGNVCPFLLILHELKTCLKKGVVVVVVLKRVTE